MNAFVIDFFFHNFLCLDAGVCFFFHNFFCKDVALCFLFLEFRLESRPSAVAPAEVKYTDLVDNFHDLNCTVFPIIVTPPFVMAVKRHNT
jgi:hypothetical protein